MKTDKRRKRINVYRIAMPSKEDWVVVGLILGALAILGIGIFVLRKKSSPQRIQLKRVQPQVMFTNLERRKVIRDREGNIKEVIITREVKAHD